VSRAIGGTLMFVSHLLFAYNFYYMVKNRRVAGNKSVLQKEINQAELKEYV
jgi:cbb3-type cytochrome oxidase subunit 1